MEQLVTCSNYLYFIDEDEDGVGECHLLPPVLTLSNPVCTGFITKWLPVQSTDQCGSGEAED